MDGFLTCPAIACILATRVSLMRFQKARGLTASEQLLAELCEKSFLSVWSYPNLCRKQGKELTDLLVVFGDDVILFSDKSRKAMTCSRVTDGNPARKSSIDSPASR